MSTSGTTWPADVLTLAIDIGGSGFKASVLDAAGGMTTDRVRIDTPYPCPPEVFTSTVAGLVAPLPTAHRVSVGFPGLVRNGRVVEVPSLSRVAYGGRRDKDLVRAWQGFDLETTLTARLQRPTKVVNDADMQGCAVVRGDGIEFVVTLGTGVGTALFADGALLPHLELSHGPFKDGLTIDVALGNAERKQIGHERWSKRVRKAIGHFADMIHFDHLYVGGGNAKLLTAEDVGPVGTIVPNTAGILGGVRVWDLAP